MGTNRKEEGLNVIALLHSMGQILGYYSRGEELMFPGNPNSPELDVTWRRTEHAKFPLFIFEVESVSAKAASDNAVKVFARKTPAFEKPLFFFRIFLDDEVEPERIDYLTDSFDKLNDGTYRLKRDADNLRLVKDGSSGGSTVWNVVTPSFDWSNSPDKSGSSTRHAKPPR